MKTTYVAGKTPSTKNRIAGRIRPKTPAGGNGNGNGTSPPTTGRPSGKPAPQKPCGAELELLAQRWEQLKAAAKKAYSEADVIELQLIAAIGVGGSLRLSDGRRLSANDNFTDKNGHPKNVSYRPCGVRRFEVEIK